MKTIAIAIGHGPKTDQGAENAASGTTELEWNRDLAKKIKDAIGERARAIIINRVTEKLQPVAETNATNADAAVELHLNAYNGKASGTEMIHYETSKRGRELAIALQHAAVDVLGLPDRGAKGPQGGGRGERWLRDTAMPSVIVESFFLDRDSDLQRGNERKDALAKAYADVLVAFVGAAQSTPETTQTTVAVEPKDGAQPRFKVTGRMSTFGGPKDTGVSPSEGLAIFEASQIDGVDDTNGTRLFLAGQPSGTTGLARRLNPDAFYLACRWDYAVTSKAFLRGAVVKLSANGKQVTARACDWGPNERTGRVADLSPGAAKALGLSTDDTVTVEIS